MTSKRLGNPPVFSGREEDFYVLDKKFENYVSGVFPNVLGASTFGVDSQDAVTATSVALGVPELEAETSTEIDATTFRRVVSPHGRWELRRCDASRR